MHTTRMTNVATLVLSLVAVPPSAAGATEKDAAGASAPADMKTAILSKLEYDRSYFQKVVALKGQGKTDTKLSRAEFEKEAVRAVSALPVLEKIFDEKARYIAGKPFTVPANDEARRVYSNLVTLLNMLQATDARDFQAVVDAGQRVQIKEKRDLGLVRSDDARYYLNLYREFFYLMAVAHYRLGHDADAVGWLARIEADADVQKLKKLLSTETAKRPIDTRAERLAYLQTRPLAVVPFENLEKSSASDPDAWIGGGIAEVLSNDLTQHSDLIVVERTSVAKVLKEVALSQSGITDEKNAQNVGKMLSAGALLVGSYRVKGDKVFFSLRLVDAEDGRSVASKDAELRSAELFPDARKILLGLLGDIGWLTETTRSELEAARSPRPETIRDLLKARLLLASKSADAKELYAKAMKDDPAYAKAFEDLKKEFSALTSALAVMPFVNSAGVADDLWMSQGAAEALTTDLPKMGFNVVERTQLAAHLRERELGQVLDPEAARTTGQLAGADFVALGSVMHQKPRVRIDVRFVDVRTGLVLNAASADGRADDFPKLLVTLSTEIAKRFNEKLSEETLSQLAGRKMSRDEFEKFARQQLAKEALARKVVPAATEEAPSRSPFWLAVTGAFAGTAMAATGFVVAAKHNDAATYSEALLAVASRASDQERLMAEHEKELRTARILNVVGFGGVGVAAASISYFVYQELKGPDTVKKVAPGPTAALELHLGPSVAVVGLGGTF